MRKKAIVIGTVVLMILVVFTLTANVQAASDQDPDWVAQYGNYRYEYAYDTCVDPQGNVITVGYGDVGYYSYDCIVLKYDPDGNLLWARNWNSPYRNSEYGYAVVTDPAGNIYVAGNTYTSYYATREDFFILKYSPNGALQWARLYDYGRRDYEYMSYYGQPLQYDNGRVYVCGYGYTRGSTMRYNYITLCVDANSGFRLWTRDYDGGMRYGYDYARSLVVTGNYCIVTGYSDNSWTDYDVATVCYNKYTGTQYWVRRFHIYDYDYGYDICADNSGRVFVTGEGELWGTYSDYASITIAYSAASGAQLWSDVYDYGNDNDYDTETRGIECDPNTGQVYSTGTGYLSSFMNYHARDDIVCIAHDMNTGARNWVGVYDGPRSSYSYDSSISKPAVDPTTGNVVIVGESDSLDNTYDDLIVVSFTPTGSLAMSGRYSAPYRYDSVYVYSDAAVDAEGNIYSSCRHDAWPTSSYDDMYTLKFASAIPAEVVMEPQSLNLDSNGNYVQFKVEGFPENPEHSPLDVDVSSCVVEGVGADLKFGTNNKNHAIGKADRLMVEDAIGAPGQEVEVNIKGKLTTGKSFKGTAIIKAILN
jgi:hypothetical protein